MANVHMVVGTLVLIAYILLAIFYFLGSRGSTFPWVRYLSFGAAGLLLIQYIIGFNLLGGSGEKPNPIHYVVALAAIFTVGAEHALAQQQPTAAARNRTAMLASIGTVILVLIAYAIGSSTAG